MKTGSLLASILLSIVAFGHLLRFAFGIDITVGNAVVPQWPSVVGFLFPVVIVWLLWKEGRRD